MSLSELNRAGSYFWVKPFSHSKRGCPPLALGISWCCFSISQQSNIKITRSVLKEFMQWVTRRIRKPQLTWMYLSSVASVGLSLMRNFICLKVISEAPPLEPFTVSLWAVTLVDMAVAIICFLLLNFVSIICTGYIEFPNYLKHQLGLAFCRHFNWANF